MRYALASYSLLCVLLLGCAQFPGIGNQPDHIDQAVHVGAGIASVCLMVNQGKMSVEDAQFVLYESALLREKIQHLKDGSRDKPFEEWCDVGCQRDLSMFQLGGAIGELCVKDGGA